MDENSDVTALTVVNRAVKLFRDPEKSDLLILTLRTLDDGDFHFALDRRMAEHVSAALVQVAKKLSAPRHEN